MRRFSATFTAAEDAWRETRPALPGRADGHAADDGGPTEAGQGDRSSRRRPEPTPRGKEAALGDEAVRSPRTASKDIAARQKPEFQAIGSALRCSPNETDWVSRKLNSVKVVMYIISGFSHKESARCLADAIQSRSAKAKLSDYGRDQCRGSPPFAAAPSRYVSSS